MLATAAQHEDCSLEIRMTLERVIVSLERLQRERERETELCYAISYAIHSSNVLRVFLEFLRSCTACLRTTRQMTRMRRTSSEV